MVNGSRLGRDHEHRWAMLRNMVTSLIYHERIVTTTAKAKELRKVADRMITHAKAGTPKHRVLAGAVVREQPALVKLFEILGPRYILREGGYTRVMRLMKQRRGDSAEAAIIEFVDREGELRKPRAPQKTLEDIVKEEIAKASATAAPTVNVAPSPELRTKVKGQKSK